jgi:uncharacterized membrane protein YfcA
MEQLVIELTVLVSISIVIGIMASMTGISGGAFKTPILIIIFALSAELAAAASLLSACFVALIGTISYYRQDSQLIHFKVGILAVIATIPGSYFGVFLRTIAAHAHLLQLLFGVILFPIAIRFVVSRSGDKEKANDRSANVNLTELGMKRRVTFIVIAFLAGISAGLLGLGGGTIIVPMLYILLEFPIIVAAATSMFTMIFTSLAGSFLNYLVFAQTENLNTFLFFGLIMSLGMILGGVIGPRYASRVNAVQLQRLFGFLLIFPLIKMMRIGHYLLDPGGSNYMLATIGDGIIWLAIGIPIWVVASHRMKSYGSENVQGVKHE